MPIYKVWDEVNGDEDGAEEIEAYDAEDAAKEYAENDNDGFNDGLYHDGGEALSSINDGHPIMVRSEDGTLSRFLVGVEEFQPVFRAMKVDLVTTKEEPKWPRYRGDLLSERALEILHHAIGVQKNGRHWTEPYRNHFVASVHIPVEGQNDYIVCESLFSLGYLKIYDNTRPSTRTYSVTPAGLAVIGYRVEEVIK